MKSSNWGMSWIQTKLPNSYVNCIEVDKNNTIFANTFLSGISYSTDRGETWYYSGLNDVDVKTIAINSQNYIFAGGRIGKGLSNAAMDKLLQVTLGYDCTVHGFRSTFRDWAAERTNFSRRCYVHRARSSSIEKKSTSAR